MSNKNSKYTSLENGRLEINDDFSRELAKLTAKQLRYVINRLVFPDESHAEAARAAGYAIDSAGVRALELEKRPFIRLMLTRCEEIRPRDPDDFESVEMMKADLVAWHTRMIRNEAVQMRLRIASAKELSILNGWISAGKDEPDEADNAIARIMKRIDGKTTGLPSQRGESVSDYPDF